MISEQLDQFHDRWVNLLVFKAIPGDEDGWTETIPHIHTICESGNGFPLNQIVPLKSNWVVYKQLFLICILWFTFKCQQLSLELKHSLFGAPVLILATTACGLPANKANEVTPKKEWTNISALT